MVKYNINYGIDLGTTNSSIARMNGNRVEVIQIGSSFIMPSCVHYRKNGECFVGEKAYNEKRSARLDNRKNTFSEFKNTMGIDTLYESSHAKKEFSSEELSSLVLKQLQKSVRDENLNAAVITVPADFDQTQIDATKRAGEMSGFAYIELLQEPIAASIAYLNEKKDLEGTWLVFDFGGGTFDAALVSRKEGIMEVVDTRGDNNLGGKNIDEAIVDEIVFPYLLEKYEFSKTLADDTKRNNLRVLLKYYAEECKKELTEKEKASFYVDDPIIDDNGDSVDLEIDITRPEFNKVISKIADRAIDITKKLLSNNNLEADDLLTILPVGGPTYIPYFRERIGNDLSLNIDYSINPMTAVSSGAAISAATTVIPQELQQRELDKKQLVLGYPGTTAEDSVTLGIQVKDSKDDGYSVNISLSDQSWDSGNIELNEGAAVVKLDLVPDSMNHFEIKLFDNKGHSIECDPSEISIQQGTKISNPPLTHHVGISAVDSNDQETFVPIIEKGTPLPASAKKEFYIKKNIRPANASDLFKVILWEGEHNKPQRNSFAGEMVITGERVTELVPADTSIEIKLNIDKSRTITASAYIDYTDDLFEEVFPTGQKQRQSSNDDLMDSISEEKGRIKGLEGSTGADQNVVDEINNKLNEIDELNNKNRGSNSGNQQVKKQVNELGSKIDRLESELKWPEKEKEVDDVISNLNTIISSHGTSDHQNKLDNILSEYPAIKESKDLWLAESFISKLSNLRFEILTAIPEWWASILVDIKENFDTYNWKNRGDAESYIDQGSGIISSGSYSGIENIVRSLWQLMSRADVEKTTGGRTDIPGIK